MYKRQELTYIDQREAASVVAINDVALHITHWWPVVEVEFNTEANSTGRNNSSHEGRAALDHDDDDMPTVLASIMGNSA